MCSFEDLYARVASKWDHWVMRQVCEMLKQFKLTAYKGLPNVVCFSTSVIQFHINNFHKNCIPSKTTADRNKMVAVKIHILQKSQTRTHFCYLRRPKMYSELDFKQWISHRIEINLIIVPTPNLVGREELYTQLGFFVQTILADQYILRREL